MKKWRLRKKEDAYDIEEVRLRLRLAELDPLKDADDYDALQTKLSNTIKMRTDSRESRRKIAKSDRGGIIMRVIGVLGAIGGAFMIGKFERDGNTWTGEKRSFMDSVSRLFGNLFFKDRF